MIGNRIANLRRIIRASAIGLLNPRSVHKLSRQFVFIHIPKTGGTSLHMTLMDSLHPHELYPNALEYFLKLKGNEKTSAHQLVNQSLPHVLKQRNWFVAHLDYHAASTLVENPILFTFLRDPFDRVVSEIVHLKCHDSALKHLSLEQIIKKRVKIAGRLQAHQFGFREQRQNINQAIENLHRCDYIGFSDQMKASIERFNQLFGTSLRSDIHVNTGNSELREEVIQRHGEQIEEHLAIDTMFYESAMR